MPTSSASLNVQLIVYSYFPWTCFGSSSIFAPCFGNKKESQGSRSGEYGGCGKIIVLFLEKNSRTSNDV